MKGTVKIPSDMSNLFRAENLIDELAEKLDLPDDLYANISVCVIEAVSNSIQHGNGNDVTKLVILEYTNEDNRLTFTVSDEGIGFDLDKVPDPTLPENLENFKGRGIFLIKHLSDNVTFENRGSKIIIYFNL